MSTQLKELEQDSQWKQKYVQAINEFDDKEKQWADDESALYKSILRLVLSYSGANEKLDKSLASMRKRLRQENGSEARKKIISPVIDEIIQYTSSKVAAPNQDPLLSLLDNLSLPGESGIEIIGLRKRAREIKEEQDRLQLTQDLVELLSRQNATAEGHGNSEENFPHLRDTLLELFQWLSIPKEYSTRVEQLKAQISKLQNDPDLSATLRETAIVINDLQAALQVELGDIQSFLARVTDRLEDVESNFIELMATDGESLRDTEKMNLQVEENVKRIRAGLATGDDVETIKQAIESRLQFLEQSTSNYFQSMQQHREVFDDRVKILKSRLKQMKGESISLHKRIVEEYRKAKTDALTGIANRLAYNEKINQEISRRQRNRKPLSVCVVDVDKFKGVNDTYGHKAGDKVLQTIAQVCARNVREVDFFARYGGEEFVLLLPETRAEQARVVADNLRRKIEVCKFHYAGQPVSITISCGIAEFAGMESGDVVFNRADKALYRAKQEGRNRVVVAD